tara:strand:+ start:1069 stop:1317 length:249 start_codon:yes stop_codon:yes gene_type:complete
MPFDKLYVRIKCTICDGTRLFKNSGHHSPLFPYKWKSCPYCDRDGTYLIEAHANSIVEYFNQLSDEERNTLLEKIGPKKIED